MDLCAALFGWMAERSQDEVKSVGALGFECTKRRNHSAYALGSLAAHMVGIGHVAALCLGRCLWVPGCWECCCGSGLNPPTNTMSWVAWGAMWLSFVMAEVLLVRATNENKKSSTISCHISTDGWLKWGAYAALAHLLSAIAFRFYAAKAYTPSLPATHSTA
ncbi:unnamed protein product [Cuscuta europaea]|uniref:Uncharacterized protein n=1 Tax=Cuscuta europaea TaxID=41803 RepID=A0A9P0YHA9_CUSEU|nr:unnamed protein product [Cuscuta europaea]